MTKKRIIASLTIFTALLVWWHAPSITLQKTSSDHTMVAVSVPVAHAGLWDDIKDVASSIGDSIGGALGYDDWDDMFDGGGSGGSGDSHCACSHDAYNEKYGGSTSEVSIDDSGFVSGQMSTDELAQVEPKAEELMAAEDPLLTASEAEFNAAVSGMSAVDAAAYEAARATVLRDGSLDDYITETGVEVPPCSNGTGASFGVISPEPSIVTIDLTGGDDGHDEVISGSDPTGDPDLVVYEISLIDDLNATTTTNNFFGIDIVNNTRAGYADEANLDILVEYIPQVVVTNIGGKGTDEDGYCMTKEGIANLCGEFPVLLMIDADDDGVYEYKEKQSFVGPLWYSMGESINFPPITLEKYGHHNFRAIVDPDPNVHTSVEKVGGTCDRADGCILETAEPTDNNRLDEVMVSTAPYISLGSMLYTSIPYYWTAQQGMGHNRAINSYYTLDPMTDPIRELTTDPNYNNPSVVGPYVSSLYDAIGLYWDGYKVDYASCTGTGFTKNNNPTDDFDGQPWWEQKIYTNPPESAYYGEFPYGTPYPGYTWEKETPAYRVKYYPDVYNLGLYADAQYVAPPGCDGGCSPVLEPIREYTTVDMKTRLPNDNNYHEYTITCNTTNGGTISDTHIISNAGNPDSVILRPTLDDITVDAGETVEDIAFLLDNQGPTQVSGYTYTLTVDGTTYGAADVVGPDMAVDELRGITQTGSWTAPGTAQTVPMEVCVSHSGMKDPACDDAVVTVVANPPDSAQCIDFSVTDTNPDPGDTVIFTWEVENADAVMFLNGIDGNYYVTDEIDTNFPVTFNNDGVYDFQFFALDDAGYSDECDPITVTVDKITTPTCSLTASPSTVAPNENVNVTWSFTNLQGDEEFWFDNGKGAGAIQKGFTAEANITYPNPGTYDVVGHLYGNSGTEIDVCSATIPVQTSAGDPTIDANPTIVRSGEETTITWGPNGNTGCTLTPDRVFSSSNPDADGTVTDEPVNQTTYTIDCPAGSASVTVQVLPNVQET